MRGDGLKLRHSDWGLGTISALKEWLGTGTGSPGCGGHHPWGCLGNMGMWH